MVASFAIGHSCPGGYDCGIMLGSYSFGAGCFIINSLRILEYIGQHPAADRLLINLINHSLEVSSESRSTLPTDYDSHLKKLGYE